jgi:hypothetical protein
MKPEDPIAPEGVELYDFEDHDTHRNLIFRDAKDALVSQFPQSHNGVRLELHDLDYVDGDRVSLADQKKALLENKFLARRLRGTVRLFDEETGDMLDEKTQTLMRVPYLTQRGTYVHGGNDYASIAQNRLLPGMYTRRQKSGQLETQVNVRSGTGTAFRVGLEPDTSQYRLRIQSANLHLYSLLHDLGTSDEELEKLWGKDVLTANKSKYDRRILDKAYIRLVSRWEQKPEATDEDKAKAIREALDRSQANARVLRRNVPNMFDRAKAAEWVREEEEMNAPDDTEFKPDLTPADMRDEMNRVYGGVGARLASMQKWPEKWIHPQDPQGWMQWYEQYHHGRRTTDDRRQIGRWKGVKARNSKQFAVSPTPRRAYALRNWGVDPLQYLPEEDRENFREQMEAYKKDKDERLQTKAAVLSQPDIMAVAEFLNQEHGAGLDVTAPVGELEAQVMAFISDTQGINPVVLQAGVDGLERVQKEASLAEQDNVMPAQFVKLARHGAGVLFKMPNGKYLLQENQEDDVDPEEKDKIGKLRPAGGGKNVADRNLKATILREMEEEFGIPQSIAGPDVALLGYISKGKFKDCALFEYYGHGLKPGWYQASNSKTEKIKLVEADLDDPRYIGPKLPTLRRYQKNYRPSHKSKRWESWIGVDLDGCLAEHDGPWDPTQIGEPVPAMLERVKKWIADGKTVKIFTARASTPKHIPRIQSWLEMHGLPRLEVTNVKDPGMQFLVDDKAVQVVKNKGTQVKAASDDDNYDRADMWDPRSKEFRLVDVQKLIAAVKGREAEDMPLSNIWGGSKTSPGYSEERQRLADTQYPILVDEYSEDPEQTVGLVDGRHRRLKMIEQGITHGKVIRLTPEDLDASLADVSDKQASTLTTKRPLHDWDGTVIPRFPGNAQEYLAKLRELGDDDVDPAMRGIGKLDLATARPQMFHQAIRDAATRLGLEIGDIHHAPGDKVDVVREQGRPLVDDDPEVLSAIREQLGQDMAIEHQHQRSEKEGPISDKVVSARFVTPYELEGYAMSADEGRRRTEEIDTSPITT